MCGHTAYFALVISRFCAWPPCLADQRFVILTQHFALRHPHVLANVGENPMVRTIVVSLAIAAHFARERLSTTLRDG
jgi:hypothetical protein